MLAPSAMLFPSPFVLYFTPFPLSRAPSRAQVNEDHDVHCSYALHMAVMSDRIASARTGRGGPGVAGGCPNGVASAEFTTTFGHSSLFCPAPPAKLIPFSSAALFQSVDLRILSPLFTQRRSPSLFPVAPSLPPSVYNLLVDELDADPTLLNIRGETVGPDGLWACNQRPSEWPAWRAVPVSPPLDARACVRLTTPDA